MTQPSVSLMSLAAALASLDHPAHYFHLRQADCMEATNRAQAAKRKDNAKDSVRKGQMKGILNAVRNRTVAGCPNPH